jgi:hypothetical protein
MYTYEQIPSAAAAVTLREGQIMRVADWECGNAVAAAVDGAVAELLDAAGVLAPPVDAVRLAQEHLGLTVCLDRGQTTRGRAQRTAGGRQIYLRPEPLRERHQWTVAHEIGEHLKLSLLRRLGARHDDLHRFTGEGLANLFAHRLLVPTAWLAEDARSLGYDLPALKRRYATASHEVLAWRLLDLPAPCVMTVVDNNHVTRRASNAWPVDRQLTAVERRCQEYANYYSRPRSESEGGWSVTAWPVHQPDWKREILRSVLEE